METAFLGSFKKFEMVAARATKIVAERCENNIKKLKFAAPKSDDEPIFRYERPNRLRLGDQPLVMDPYEKKTVYVQDLEQEGEQGLFAKRDIAEGEQIAFYSGVIFDDRDHTTITPNMTEEEM